MGATKALAFEEKEGRSILKVLDAIVRRPCEHPSVLHLNEATREMY